MSTESTHNESKFDFLDLLCRPGDRLRRMTEDDIRREVTAARQIEVDIQGNEEGLPSVDEMMKRYSWR